MTETLVLGDLTEDDINDLRERLHDEELIAASGYRDSHDDLRLTAVTPERIIGYQSTGPTVLGKDSEFHDIDIDTVQAVRIKEQKEFDELVVTTSHGQERFMIASQTGVAMSGEIRKLVEDDSG